MIQAVVVPVFKDQVTPEEQISLDHLAILSRHYPVVVIAPEHYRWLNFVHQTVLFPTRAFASVQSYSQLLLSPGFYKTFFEFDYILIYQLDSLVFSDQLRQWSAVGYDYIGAPLFIDKSDPKRGFSRTGNGGLSLRRVSSFLNVLESPRYRSEKIPYWQDFLAASLPDLDILPFFKRIVKRLRVIRQARHGVDWYAAAYTLNEDLFWSDRARLFLPEFKIAPVEVGLKFSFERHPRYCYEQNGCQLPFGCHAWAKWDREFWEPFLIK